MTSIPTTADLLRLLREDPDFRDEVRRLVLSQELLELPERFNRFEANVDRRFDAVDQRFDAVDRRFDAVDQRFESVDRRFDGLESRFEQRFNSIDGDLGRLKGAEYERKVSRTFTSYAGAAFRQRHNRSLRRNRLLLSLFLGPTTEYEEILSGAVDSGQISQDELDEIQQADAVMTGMDQGSPVYFVGEFSVTVNNHDIDRAVSRATILSKVTQAAVWPMVIGDTIPSLQRARAEAEGVAFRQVAE